MGPTIKPREQREESENVKMRRNRLKNQQSPRDCGTITKTSNICVIGILLRGWDYTFEEMMADNFPNLPKT